MAEWISIKNGYPDKHAIVDLWVEVKPHGYHGRLIDCYLDDGVWHDRDGELSEIFQDKVTHFMLSPDKPQTNDEIAIQDTSDWISVDDGLPEKNGFYLARSITPNDSQHTTGTLILYYCNAYRISERFQSQHRASHVTVTHWMPIPEPPQTTN